MRPLRLIEEGFGGEWRAFVVVAVVEIGVLGGGVCCYVW